MMFKRITRFILAMMVAIAVIPGISMGFYMNFEEGLGNDGGLVTGIPGVTFMNSGGNPWRYADCATGNYNAYSVNTGTQWGSGEYNMYDYVSAWAGPEGNGGRIDFDDLNGTWFQVGVSSLSVFYLEAYDAQDNLLDSASLSSGNLRYTHGALDMAFLRVDAPQGTNIAYVTLHDSGNYWTVDNLSGDMAGGIPPVPEPASAMLLGLGVVGAGLVAARRRSRA